MEYYFLIIKKRLRKGISFFFCGEGINNQRSFYVFPSRELKRNEVFMIKNGVGRIIYGLNKSS